MHFIIDSILTEYAKVSTVIEQSRKHPSLEFVYYAVLNLSCYLLWVISGYLARPSVLFVAKRDLQMQSLIQCSTSSACGAIMKDRRTDRIVDVMFDT